MSSGANSPQNSSSANRSLVGETLAGCKIEELLHVGAMGSVFRGFDELYQQTVCVNVIHPRLLRVEGFRERLQQEIEGASELKVGNNASVLRYEYLQPWLVVICRFVEGQSLRTILSSKGRLTVPQATQVIVELLDHLSLAHDLGLTHKDVKPENVIVTKDNEIFIVSWGILRVINATTKESLSSYGSLYGTPEYMAPDQITVGEHSTQSDVYSAGITFFELLTGRAPFHGDRVMEVLKKQIVEPLPAFEATVPECPTQIIDFIRQMTAKNPGQRPMDASQAGDMLRDMMEDMGLDGELESLTVDQVAHAGGEGVSPITDAALQALAERMQNSANLGMLAFEDEGGGMGGWGGYEEMTMMVAPSASPASTQQIMEFALHGDVHQALQTAQQQNKLEKVVPGLLEDLFKSERYEEILNLEDYLKSMLPGMPTVPYYVGLTHETLGNFEPAIIAFHETLMHASHHLPASLHCARCLTELKRNDEAEHVLKQATKMSPSSDVAAAKYAEFLYIVKGEAQMAVPAYQKAIRLAPNRLQLRKQLAWILIELGSFDQAEAVLSEVAEWSGSGHMIRPLLEELDKRRSQLKPHATTRVKLADLQGGQDELLAVKWPNQAKMKGKVSNWAAIREKYQNIPIPPPVDKKKKRKKNKGKLEKIQRAFAIGDYHKAINLIHVQLSEDPHNVKLLLGLGRAEFEIQNYDEAIKVYRYILKINSKNDEAKSGLSAAKLAKKKLG